MTEQQLPKLAGVLVEHQRAFLALPTDDSQWVISNTAEAIALCVQAIRNRNNGTVPTAVDVLKPEIAPATLGTLIVDFSLDLRQMIRLGKYDWVNSGITEKRYPVRPEGQTAEKVEYEYMLDYPNSGISTDTELKYIANIDKDNPWQAAKTPHLLAYGAVHPEVQRKFPVIGLGSFARICVNRGCPYLVGDDSKRNLELAWFDGRWGDVRCRFLLVRIVRKKVSVASAF